jgi:hypothetical protein
MLVAWVWAAMGRFPPSSGHERPSRTAWILQQAEKKERAVSAKTGALFEEEKGESDAIRWPSVKIQHSRFATARNGNVVPGAITHVRAS